MCVIGSKNEEIVISWDWTHSEPRILFTHVWYIQLTVNYLWCRITSRHSLLPMARKEWNEINGKGHEHEMNDLFHFHAHVHVHFHFVFMSSIICSQSSLKQLSFMTVSFEFWKATGYLLYTSPLSSIAANLSSIWIFPGNNIFWIQWLD